MLAGRCAPEYTRKVTVVTMYLEQNLISQLLGTQGAEGVGEQCPPQGRSLAMVYAPVQEWQELYDPCAALQRGTQ